MLIEHNTRFDAIDYVLEVSQGNFNGQDSFDLIQDTDGKLIGGLKIQHNEESAYVWTALPSVGLPDSVSMNYFEVSEVTDYDDIVAIISANLND